jgi:hypothetical protein
MHMADGRYDSQRVLDAAQQLARQRVLFDMQSEASDAGTVISAVLFGALAGSAALPLSRGYWTSPSPGELAALRLRAAGRGLDLPEDTALYLLRRFPRDMHALGRLLDEMDVASLTAQRRLTVPFVRAILGDP